MYKLILVALLALFANAAEFKLHNGVIKAHTEVFGDSKINPESNEVVSQVHHDESSLESLRGHVQIASLSLKSDTPDRDEHMYEMLNVTLHPKISFDFVNVVKNKEDYTVEGFLTLNGIKKEISSQATILEDDKTLVLTGNFDILVSEFGMEPPTLLFLTVRDQVDITYTLNYTKEP